MRDTTSVDNWVIVGTSKLLKLSALDVFNFIVLNLDMNYVLQNCRSFLKNYTVMKTEPDQESEMGTEMKTKMETLTAATTTTPSKSHTWASVATMKSGASKLRNLAKISPLFEREQDRFTTCFKDLWHEFLGFIQKV